MTSAPAHPTRLEPQQERSRATRRRLITAANQLLRARSFDSLSVQEIAKVAECSIGAFYGRFSGKDDLLAPLLDRHYAGIQRWLRIALADPTWRAMPLKERLYWIARMDVRVLRSRRWLIRALAVYLRADRGTLTEAQLQRRTGFTVSVRALLIDAADQIGHDDASSAIDFALFMISTLCRERVLFGELSERAWVADGDEKLVEEVSRAAFAYLTAGTGN